MTAKVTNETRKISSITVDPKNARRHSTSQIASIARSIDKFGFVQPIVTRPNGQIIGGHATLQALVTLGRTEVECRVVEGLGESQYKSLGLALNRLAENSDWDDEVLRQVLGEIDIDGEDINDLGFSPGELKKLLDEPDELEVKEIETGPVDDECWISIRAPLAQQANILKALQEAMKPYAGVTVEQGTINIG